MNSILFSTVKYHYHSLYYFRAVICHNYDKETLTLKKISLVVKFYKETQIVHIAPNPCFSVN